MTESRTRRGAIGMASPTFTGEDMSAVQQVLLNGNLAQGEKVIEFEARFAEYVGTSHAVAVSSGTAGLFLSLLALGITKGDEVITTAFSFVSTATSIVMAGAAPVFADIHRATYNLDAASVEQRITRRTRAIIPVHLYGQTCDMDSLRAVSERHGIPIIEDACQAHGAMYGPETAGSMGSLGVFSFYATKNMTTGEGGMVTTNDDALAKRLRSLRSHGQSKQYVHLELGYNFRMAEIQAALGIGQLCRLDSMNQRRSEIADYYRRHLALASPTVHPRCAHVYHQYTIEVPNREHFLQQLDAHEVGYGVYYRVPIHQQPLFSELRCSLPNAESASQRVVSLPVHPALSDDDVSYVAEVVNAQFEEGDL